MTDPPREPTAAQVFIGLFVAGQLAFMVVANVANLNFLSGPRLTGEQAEASQPALVEAARTVAERTRRLTDAWSGLTLQRQHWGLFAEFPPRSQFPALRLAWKDGQHESVLLRSFEEPDDPFHFYSFNIFADRLHNYEAWLCNVEHPPEAAAGPLPEKDQTMREALVRGYWKQLHAYLTWRLARYHRANPDTPPPDEVVLLYRVFDTPGPDEHPWHWNGPFERPLVRWRRAAQPAAGELPLELYDLAKQGYVPVKAAP